ncbi:MAG: hypothetical protein M3Z04_08600 [Chloroflexota bacterium]|nr:hypothetical protein [Chloroflexota bacterium]
MNDLPASLAMGFCLIGFALLGTSLLLLGVVVQLFTQVGRLGREVDALKAEQAAGQGCSAWIGALIFTGAGVLVLLCALLQSVAQAAH